MGFVSKLIFHSSDECRTVILMWAGGGFTTSNWARWLYLLFPIEIKKLFELFSPTPSPKAGVIYGQPPNTVFVHPTDLTYRHLKKDNVGFNFVV